MGQFTLKSYHSSGVGNTVETQSWLPRRLEEMQTLDGLKIVFENIAQAGMEFLVISLLHAPKCRV